MQRNSKKTSKLCVTGLCAGNSPVTSEFPAHKASNAENVSIWWRHHDPCIFPESVSRNLSSLVSPPKNEWQKKNLYFFVRFFSTPGPRFHIKTVFSDTGISIIKVTWLWDCLIFIIGTPILVRWYLYIETASYFWLQVFTHYGLSKMANILCMTLKCIFLNEFLKIRSDFIDMCSRIDVDSLRTSDAYMLH